MIDQQEIQTAANRSYAGFDSEENRALIASVEEYGDDHDDALERLEEQPLGVGKIVTNHRQETIEWEILLGTGGPARRILVRTDYQGRVEAASYQFQDWYTPWVDAEDQDEEFVMRYAQVVGYYEQI